MSACGFVSLARLREICDKPTAARGWAAGAFRDEIVALFGKDKVHYDTDGKACVKGIRNLIESASPSAKRRKADKSGGQGW